MATQPPRRSRIFPYAQPEQGVAYSPATQPIPETGFLENFGASAEEMELAGNIGSRDRYMAEGYRPLIDALGAAGESWVGTVGGERGYQSQGRLSFVNPYSYGGMGFNGVPDRAHARDMIFERIRERRRRDPHFLPGVPDTADAFEEQITARAAARLQELRRVQGGANFMGQVGGFLGGMAGSLEDPVNLATLPVGGGARTVLGGVARSALENMLVEGISQPFVAENYGRLGEDYTIGDATRSILFAGAGGAAFHGVTHATGALYDRVLPHIFNAVPEEVQRRWADRMSVGDVPLTEFVRRAVPEDVLTPDQRAALHVAEREDEVREASPFERTPAGDEAHGDALTAALRQVVDNVPVRPEPQAIVARGTEEAPAFRPAPTAAPEMSSPTAAADFKARVRRRESGGNDRITNPQPGQTASGRYQFTQGTFVALHRQVYGGNASAAERWAQRFDGNVQERLMDAAVGTYSAVLRRGGQAVTPGNLYLSHFFSPEVAVNILRNPGTPLENILRMTHSARFVEEIFRVNPNLRRNMTGADAAALTNRAMGGRAPERMAENEPAPTAAPVAGASAEVLDLEAQLALRDSAEPISLGREDDPVNGTPQLRRDLFERTEDWSRAQALIERQHEGELLAFPPENTRGRGTFYHGARGEAPQLTEGYYNPANIYGGFDTFYTTDAVDIASGYGRRRSDSRVYRVDEREPVRFFDMEQRRPVSEINALFGVGPDDIGFVPGAIESAALDGKVSLREAMDEMRTISAGEGVSRDEVQEGFDAAIYNLRQQGFGGMEHIGGLKTGREAHTSRIYFDAPNQIGLSDVTPEHFMAARPIAPELTPIDFPAMRFDDALRSELRSSAAPILVSDAFLKRFDEPAGAGSTIIADSLDHDIKAALGENPALAARRFLVDEFGEEATLDAILAELDGDRAAAAAIRGCL